MSAYIVSNYHINALITWAVAHEVYFYERKHKERISINMLNADSIAAELYSENVRSVNTRYGERTKRKGFVFSRAPSALRLSAKDIVRACDCLDYQSCETDDWTRTKAHAALTAIREAAINQLVEDCGTWELNVT